MEKIGIFIPCYNVQNVVHEVLHSFSDEVLDSVDQIVTIDNVSTDQTLKTLETIQKGNSKLAKRLIIIKNLQNYGLGGSSKIAYRYFIDNGFTHFMVIHGDNQGNGNEIAMNFLDAFRKDPDVDFVIASRFVEKSNLTQYNSLRTLGNHLFNFLTYLLTGYKMSDSGAGILFYRTEILNQISFEELTNGSQFNPQLNILIHSTPNLKILEIPLHWQDSIEESTISSFNYCITLLKILVHYRIHKTFFKKSGWELFHSKPQNIEPTLEIIKH